MPWMSMLRRGPRCAECGERLAVEEPVVAISGGQTVRGAHDPRGQRPAGPLWHEHCFDEVMGEPTSAGSGEL